MEAAEPINEPVTTPIVKPAARRGAATNHRSATREAYEREGNEPGSDGLTRREHAILAFERQWWKYAGAKERAIKEIFDLSPTRYYQLLNDLVERKDALRVDPMLIKRLRRTRASRHRSRAARKLGIEPR